LAVPPKNSFEEIIFESFIEFLVWKKFMNRSLPHIPENINQKLQGLFYWNCI